MATKPCATIRTRKDGPWNAKLPLRRPLCLLIISLLPRHWRGALLRVIGHSTPVTVTQQYRLGLPRFFADGSLLPSPLRHRLRHLHSPHHHHHLLLLLLQTPKAPKGLQRAQCATGGSAGESRHNHHEFCDSGGPGCRGNRSHVVSPTLLHRHASLRRHNHDALIGDLRRGAVSQTTTACLSRKQ